MSAATQVAIGIGTTRKVTVLMNRSAERARSAKGESYKF